MLFRSALIATEDTVKDVKKVRADLTKTFNELEDGQSEDDDADTNVDNDDLKQDTASGSNGENSENMDVQSLLNRISFLEDEVHRCYAELENYEVKIEAYEDALYENILNDFKKYLKETKGRR